MHISFPKGSVHILNHITATHCSFTSLCHPFIECSVIILSSIVACHYGLSLNYCFSFVVPLELFGNCLRHFCLSKLLGMNYSLISCPSGGSLVVRVFFFVFVYCYTQLGLAWVAIARIFSHFVHFLLHSFYLCFFFLFRPMIFPPPPFHHYFLWFLLLLFVFSCLFLPD